MRRKERRGPGMTTTVEAAGVLPSADCGTASSERWKTAGGAPQALTGKHEHREIATTTNTQRGNFTAGFLSEPLRLLHLNAGRTKERSDDHSDSVREALGTTESHYSPTPDSCPTSRC